MHGGQLYYSIKYEIRRQDKYFDTYMYMANLHDVWYMYLTVEDINKTKIKKNIYFF